MSRLFRLSAFAVAALLFSASTALPHSALLRAEPKVGSTVNSPPEQVQLWFSEPVEPAFSTAVVSNAAGAVVGSNAKVAADDRRRLELALPALPAGVYRVDWSIVSIDGHKTSGSFIFTVK